MANELHRKIESLVEASRDRRESALFDDPDGLYYFLIEYEISKGLNAKEAGRTVLDTLETIGRRMG